MGKRVVALAAVIAAFVLSGSPAWAHNTLVEASPDKNATLAKAPAEVKLRFLAALPAGTKLEVTDSGGASAIGAVKLSGKFVSAPFTGTTGGAYKVTYELTSSDGHPVRNSYTFTLTAGPSVAPSPSVVDQPASAVSVTATSPQAAPAKEETSWTPWIVGPAIIGLLVGGLFAYMQGRRKKD